MKPLYLIIATMLFIWSCSDQTDLEPKTAVFEFSNGIKIDNNRMNFESIETFQTLVKELQNSVDKQEELQSYQKGNNFNSLAMFYGKITEEKLQPIFKNKKMIPEYEAYLYFQQEDDEFFLEKTVPESFLQLVANDKMEFEIDGNIYKIGLDEISITSNKDGFKKSSISILRKNISQPRGLRGTEGSSNSRTYWYNGDKYKLKVDVNTSSTSIIPTAQGNQTLWNFVSFEAKHRKRNFWVYWAANAKEIQIQGNYQKYIIISNNVHQVQTVYINEPINLHSSGSIHGNDHVGSYNATAYCKGYDNTDYQISTSGNP